MTCQDCGKLIVDHMHFDQDGRCEGGRTMEIDWKHMQSELGCEGCQWVDKKALGKDAACTYPGALDVDPENGKCKTRKAEQCNPR